jgi:hypothetical protein
VLAYSADRFAALMLVRRNKISSVDNFLRRHDGHVLETAVLASLLALQNHGYIETHPVPVHSRHWPVRLSGRGMDLLSRFEAEHQSPTQGTSAAA